MALLVHAPCEDFTDEVCKSRQRSNTNVFRCQDYEIIIKSHNSGLVYPVLDFLLPVPTTWVFNLGMDTSNHGLFQETHYHLVYLFYHWRVWESSSLIRIMSLLMSSTSLDFSFNMEQFFSSFSAAVLQVCEGDSCGDPPRSRVTKSSFRASAIANRKSLETHSNYWRSCPWSRRHFWLAPDIAQHRA